MAVEGTLDLFQLPEILQVISQQKKTGILTVQGPQDIVAVSFFSGRIVAVDALNQPLEEGLAKILVSESVLSASEVARANAEHHASGVRLVDLLVDQGFLERSQLLQVLRLQTFRLLEQLLGWQEGDFKFYSGDEVSFEEGFQPISVEELLIRAAQRMVPLEPPRPRSPAPSAVPPATSHPAVSRDGDPGGSAVRPDLRLVARAVEEDTVRSTGGYAAPLVPPPAIPAVAPAPQREREEPAVAAPSSPYRRMVAEDRSDDLPKGARAGKLLALALVAAVVVLASLVPNGLALPLPWQDRDREVLLHDQRSALFLKIDRAAKTFFLVKGQFPDRLSELVASDLLAAQDLTDPSGSPLGYVPSAESYRLYPQRKSLSKGSPQADAEVDESITGNFLLDPEFSSGRSETETAPLVLID